MQEAGGGGCGNRPLKMAVVEFGIVLERLPGSVCMQKMSTKTAGAAQNTSNGGGCVWGCRTGCCVGEWKVREECYWWEGVMVLSSELRAECILDVGGQNAARRRGKRWVG